MEPPGACCPCHQRLEEVDLHISALEGGHTPQPLRYLALGEQGTGFCWGVSFLVTHKSTGGQWSSGMGGGRVLGNLMFRTLNSQLCL